MTAREQLSLGSSEAAGSAVSAKSRLKAKVATKVIPALAMARTQHATTRMAATKMAATKTAAPETFRSDVPTSADWEALSRASPPWTAERPQRAAAATSAMAMGATAYAYGPWVDSCDEPSCVTHAQRSKQRREARREQKRTALAQACAASQASSDSSSAYPWRAGSVGGGSGRAGAGARPTVAAARPAWRWQQAYRDILSESAVVALRRLDDASSGGGGGGRRDGVAEAAAEATRADMDALVECFEEADIDMSGEIDERECELLLAALHRKWPDEPFSRREVAGSGFSGRVEVRTASELMFAQLNGDGNGRVTFAEFAMHRQRQHWARLSTCQPLSRKSSGLSAECSSSSSLAQ